MNPDRTVLTDFMWKRIENILPGKKTDPGGTAKDNRLFPAAVLWRKRVGSPWHDLPERFGKWNSVYKRFRRWAEPGVFERIFKALPEKFDLGMCLSTAPSSRHTGRPPARQGEPGARESAAPGAVCPARPSRLRTRSASPCGS